MQPARPAHRLANFRSVEAAARRLEILFVREAFLEEDVPRDLGPGGRITSALLGALQAPRDVAQLAAQGADLARERALRARRPQGYYQ